MPTLITGTRLGPYEVLDPIGAGGMGEVYRATDTQLKRQVALKVLPASLTADPDRLARFQREAEVLASLNHPNIAGLHGLEESGGVKALVMELVEGPTLAERIALGPVPLDEALAIARQIAEALEAAHDRNIIHRDLKPANIKLRPDGTVKILDFGLAKAMEPTFAPGASARQAATITSPAQMTGAGVILGTAAYMSPEQAAGKPVDRRTDMWAFGVVLLEMLTGRRVFDGETVSHVIAAVLKDEPDWSALPQETPATVRKLLRRCLEKDRRKRMPDAAVARLECDDAIASPRDAAVDEASAPVARSRGLWRGVAGMVAGVVVASAIAWTRWPAVPAAPASIRFAVDLPADQVFTRAGRHVVAISPDGMHLAYVANRQLYLRSLRELEAKVINGTADSDPAEPIFSPDGQWIVYWSNGKLRKIPTTGGTAGALADVQNPYGISWSGDRILIAQDQPRAIVAVPANGGPPTTLMTVDESKNEWVQSPQLIDSGRAVLFTVRTGTGAWHDASIAIQDLRTAERTVLVVGGTDARVLPTGHLVYSREATLFAVPFDEERRAVTGPAVPVQQDILQAVGGFSGASQTTWSSAGTFAFIPDDMAGANRELSWMNRRGTLQPADLPARPHWPSGPSLSVSPDGKRVAMRLLGTSRSLSDIWIWEIGRNTVTRLTFDGTATDPVWTPDGARVCYESADTLWCQPFDGSGSAQSLFKISGLSTISDVSPDGAAMFLNVNNRRGSFDIVIASSRPPFETRPLMATPSDEHSATISPDGRWVAYISGGEVYVRPFPSTDQGRWQVSPAGGGAPRWAADGRELYFLDTPTGGASLALTLMAVPVLSATSFTTGPPAVIADLPLGVNDAYDVAPDGRFLISAPGITGSGPARQRVVVVQNWFGELQSRVPTTAAR